MGSILKVKYIVETMTLNPKVLKVMISFKRIPTQQQLEKFQAQQQNGGQKPTMKPQMTGIPGLSIMQMMFGDDNVELTLNFNEVKIVLPVEEANNLHLGMGDVVEFNMPETKDDIVKVNDL